MRDGRRRWIEARLLELSLGLAVLLSLWIVAESLAIDRLQQYSLLAQSFLEGRLDVDPDRSAADEPTHHAGARYVPMGPGPAVLLLPFVAAAKPFGVLFRQGWLGIALVAGVYAAARRLAGRAGYGREERHWLAFALVFGSAFLGVAVLPISNFFAHVVVVLLVLLALLEHQGRRRPLVLGLLLAGVLATRLSAALGIAFFAISLARARVPAARRARDLLLLAAPVALAALALALYNHARFGDPLETGYAAQAVPDPLQHAARAYGVVSVRHLLGNLYYMLLSPPLPVFAEGTVSVFEPPFFRPNPWGTSVFVTSPWLAYLFALRRPDATTRLLLATAAAVALPLLFTWSMGYAQFGYRFALDFLPYVWLALALGLRQRFGVLTTGFRSWVVAAAASNGALLLVMRLGATG